MNNPELFRISVKAVICVDGRVVVLRKSRGEWDLPGGRLGPNEDIFQCLAREVHEEMGVTVTMGPVVYCGVRRRLPPKQNVVVVAHVCTPDVALDEVVLSEEHTDMRLVTRHELADLGLVGTYHEALEQGFAYMGA